MIIIYKFNDNTNVIFDPLNELECNDLNQDYFDNLKKDSNLVLNDTIMDKGTTITLQRFSRSERWVVACGYADIKNTLIIETLKEYCDKRKIHYAHKLQPLPDDVKEILLREEKLPETVNYRGATGGGSTRDQKDIEKGILPLVNAMNKFDGITTFGSCEGHAHGDNKVTRANISFNADNIESLHKLGFSLDKACQKMYNHFNLEENEWFNTGQLTNRIDTHFYAGYWKNKPPAPSDGVFFDFQYHYLIDFQDQVFEHIMFIAENL